MKKILLTLTFLMIFTLSLFAEDYYWVSYSNSGQGDWSDLNHWVTPNGTPSEVPDAADNVFFNESSGFQENDTVFISTGNPTCKNLTFINIPCTIYIVGGSSSSVFSIYGSITLNSKLKNEYMGKLSLLSSNQETITCNSSKFSSDLLFNGDGEWILQDTLFLYDSANWKIIIYDDFEPAAQNPYIFHKNGTFNANGQTIITRGFQTIGSENRICNIQNSDILMDGNWFLSGENLTFNAANSYILMRGTMNNYIGDYIVYHNIDFLPPSGDMKNHDITTYMNYVHFLGAGFIDGKKMPIEQKGTFTIDTLIMEGMVTMAGPITNTINGINDTINYTQLKWTMGYIETDKSIYHRIDYEGYVDPFNTGSYLKGLENKIDSIHFFVPKGALAGDNIVNNLLFFKTDGVLSSWILKNSNINNVVFSADGIINGSNTIDSLILNSGFWYQLAADSLSAGGYYTNTHNQHINYIDVIGGCTGGLSILSSDYNPVRALIYSPSFTTDFLQIKDIENLITTSTITVNNGVDLGNNIGFDITESGERNLFWVGGIGNWNDITHWSLTSGAVPGDQCPPTIIDNVTFDANSGFDVDAVVNVNNKYATFHDMLWTDNVQNLPIFAGSDTNNLKISGSVKLSTSMIYAFPGKVYFEAKYDPTGWEVEEIDWENYDDGLNPTNPTYAQPVGHSIYNKVYFNAYKGRWQLQNNLYISDTCFLMQGDLYIPTYSTDYRRILSVYNFYAGDTLEKGLYLEGLSQDTLGTLIEVHAYGEDAFTLNAWRNDTIFGAGGTIISLPKFYFKAGNSTIRSEGDVGVPQGGNPGRCNIKTVQGADTVKYYNVEFKYENETTNLNTLFKPVVAYSEKSILITECVTQYNLVDYYCAYGDAFGNGIIDTLTYKKIKNEGEDTLTISADGCKIRQKYHINFLIAESANDTVTQYHTIDSAFFYNQGMITGNNNIGYLESHGLMHIALGNTIDTALLIGNTKFSGDLQDGSGQNRFSQLILTPNSRYIFQHENNSDTTIIKDDLIIDGDCSLPIRLESDSIGTQATILYKMESPTNNFTANYTSIRDINMAPVSGKVYIAESSVNLGNNTGWIWNNANNNIYYWIGGSGIWSDWQHWSNESGGLPITEMCVPKEINTVIFDDLSFINNTYTVTIDVKNAYCKNMYWKNSANYKPIFIGTDSTVLYVYGSLELSDSLDYQYRGLIYFDQFEDPTFDGDTITSRNHVLLNDIRFQGLNDNVILADDLTLLVDATAGIFRRIWFENGKIDFAENNVNTGGFISTYKSLRELNMENSRVTIQFDDERAWWVDATNFTLYADNSTIDNQSMLGTIFTENGNNLKYYNIELNNFADSIANRNNITEYNLINANSESGLITGNFIADTIYLNGDMSTIDNTSTINVAYLNGYYSIIKSHHHINRCFVNKESYIYDNGNNGNYIKYCIFYDDGHFAGPNVFDTLVLYPGSGNENGSGNIYHFQTNSIQTVNDSLYVRGNPCSNITLTSEPAGLPQPNKYSYIKKDNGFDLVSDYLNIFDVCHDTENSNIDFYAGSNSTPLPDVNEPTPGWIFDNAQGYISGFGGNTVSYCIDTTYTINAMNFNGDENTLYYWNGSPYPGGINYTITEPGTYEIRVVYSENCDIVDYIVIEGKYPPEISVGPGPYCEGDVIPVSVSPDNNYYEYVWFNGETGSQIIADLNYTGEIYVTVTDTTNGCDSYTNQIITVKPTPTPDVYLGDDITLVYGDTLILNAGEGDTFNWTSTPEVQIDRPNDQIIVVEGYEYAVEYTVEVDLDGCIGEGYIVVSMHPPSKWGVPTAFSPNGDGVNDVLYVYGSGFAKMLFRVFDRYGKLIFETDNPDRSEGWNGKVDGFDQPLEVYTYYLSIEFEDGSNVSDKGNITLLR